MSFLNIFFPLENGIYCSLITPTQKDWGGIPEETAQL